MATSPSSFFFPTTAPAYVPTTVFSPPPSGFGAPAYGHYPSPFPYTFSSYPTPASGFSPAPAYGSSSFPSAATYHHPFPSPSHSPIPIQIDPNQPPPASPINGNPHLKPHLFPLLHNPTCLPDSQATAPSTTAPPTTGAPAKSSSPAHHTLQARLDKQMVRDRTSLDKLHGELSKLSTLVSQFAVAMGMETTEASVTGSSPAITPAQFSSPATTAPMFSGTGAAASSSASSLSSLDASATAYVVPQMFDEMPQRYGLHNLNHHSLVLADGTEHNYFTLPIDYPLERDVPEPVFIVYDDKSDGRPNESVHMFISIPEQQPFEEEKRESCQAPKCFSKPTFSPERPTVGTVGVFSLTSEQSICDLEKLNDGENLLFEKQDIEQFLSCSNKASKCRICDEEGQGDAKKLWDKIVCRTATGHSILFFLWDPGATKFPVLFMTAAHATRLQFTYVYNPTINSSEILRHMVIVLSCWLFSFENRDKMQWDPGIANSSYMYSWLKMRAVVRLTWLQRPSVSDLQCQLPMSNTSCVWDPGDNTILNSTLNRDIVGVLQTSILTTSGTFTLPYGLTVRVQFGEPTCVPQQSCYSRVPSSQENHGIHFLWDPGIVKWSTFSAQHILESSMKKGNIFSTGRMLPWNPWYAVLLFHHFLWEFLLDMVLGKIVVSNLVLSGFHMHMIQLVHCTSAAKHARSLVPALLPSTQISTHASSNTEVGELTSRYLVFHLHQITNLTSPTSSVIRSFENAYSMVCPNRQWEFLHQQGVQKKYTTKNLLSSQSYLQIWEMDIIFITFLPP